VTSSIVPSSQQSSLLEGLEPGSPVVMINLLRFRPPDGELHYARYAREVGPHLERVGARALYGGTARAMVIGEGERPWWDAVLAVEYPSPAAFAEMVGDEGYQAVHAHREAALERAELIATAPWRP